MTDFSTLPLSPALQPGLDALGYTTLTPVQAQSLPAILDGRDVIAQAPTGSGKTAAFGLGLLQAIVPSLIRVQALVLCPTRELADQVGKQIRKLATGIPNLKLLLLVGGVPLGPQLASLEGHDPHVVVGTPGRVQELARKRALNLGAVRTLVLDEAAAYSTWASRSQSARSPAAPTRTARACCSPPPSRTASAPWRVTCCATRWK